MPDFQLTELPSDRDQLSSPNVLATPRLSIETWRRDYYEERPKNALGGLTPAAYAKQLPSATVTTGL